MDSKDNLMRLYDLLDREVQKIVDKNDISPAELERIDKAVCLMKKIEEMQGMDDGYSETGYYDSTYHGRSMTRGRSPVTGRYISREGHSMRMNGHSGHSIKDRAVARLEEMMDEAGSEYEREELSSMIRKIEASK